MAPRPDKRSNIAVARSALSHRPVEGLVSMTMCCPARGTVFNPRVKQEGLLLRPSPKRAVQDRRLGKTEARSARVGHRVGWAWGETKAGQHAFNGALTDPQTDQPSSAGAG